MNIEKSKSKSKSGKSKKAIGIAMAAVMVTTIFVILTPAAFGQPSVPPGEEAIYYLVPQNSNATYNNTQTIDVWVNTTYNITAGTVTIETSDKSCANITGGAYNSTEWTVNGAATIEENGKRIILGYSNYPTSKPPGVYPIGNIMVHCNSTTPCDANLNFVGDNYIDSDISGGWKDYDIPGQNGTFECLGTAAAEPPDLLVESIDINPDEADVTDELFVNESNKISAVIKNNGTGDAGAFDVCFNATNASSVAENIGCVSVSGLTAGSNKTINITWTPNCTDYPVSTLYPVPGIACTLNVTADCNCAGKGTITETNEGNNSLTEDTKVYNNGYKSKNFDCNTTEDPLITLFEEEQLYGGVVYDVSGEESWIFRPGDSDTRIHHIEDIPEGMTVKKARLYVYWYDYLYNNPPGCLANLSVNFSNSDFMSDAKYTDQKGFGSTSATSKGTYAYNVTSEVTGNGDYTAIVKNIDPNNRTALLGEMLLVVYEDPSQQLDPINLWMMEGCDLLRQGNHGVAIEEATSTVTFPGTIPGATGAELITVVAEGMESGSNMLFNDEVIKTDAWDSPTEAYPNSKINVESVNVTANLTTSGNNMGFRDTGTNGMQPSNAILVVSGAGAAPAPAPTADSFGVGNASGTSGTYVEVPVNVTNITNSPVQGIRLKIDYNESVLNLTSISNSDLTVNWTHLQFGEDRHTMTIATTDTGTAIQNGSSGSVVLLNFSVIGSAGDTSPMNMTLIELANHDGKVGTAPAKNGTFVVPMYSSIAGRITYTYNEMGIAGANEMGIAGAKINLTNETAVVNTTETNETGYYNFTDVIPDSYVVNASKQRFWDNSTEVEVTAGETATADMTLWQKGDLNNDDQGKVGDAGDVLLMLKVSVGDETGDMRYDLNGNDRIGDAGDVLLILRASVGDIELL